MRLRKRERKRKRVLWVGGEGPAEFDDPPRNGRGGHHLEIGRRQASVESLGSLLPHDLADKRGVQIVATSESLPWREHEMHTEGLVVTESEVPF
jgi:hypothetical protein